MKVGDYVTFISIEGSYGVITTVSNTSIWVKWLDEGYVVSDLYHRNEYSLNKLGDHIMLLSPVIKEMYELD